MHDSIAPDHQHSHAQNRFGVIPITEKLQADARFSGRGVNIAFLDSGFFPHPDIADRVIAFHDIHGEESSFDQIKEPKAHHWHGTQTTVVSTGDGTLSDGVYRGLAYNARLVLVKASNRGKIDDCSIEAGLKWILENRERLGIRILNISLGGDRDAAISESTINRLVEQLTDAGVVVTAAAGNTNTEGSIPPASSPSAVTVGGFSDENQFEPNGFELYHSSFGATADGNVKPEIIAPAMYVAAPILPGTDDYNAAEALSDLTAAPDYLFRLKLSRNWREAGLGREVLALSINEARMVIATELQRRKIVATHYQQVDGTSFAAPIAASAAAQMLEANPRLGPRLIKDILISTASRLSGHSAIRQGFGMLNAKLAAEKAHLEMHYRDHRFSIAPRIDRDRILFRYHNDEAIQVHLCGDFNGWGDESIAFERNRSGIWQAAIPCRPQGSYRYKFLVDGKRWTEDPSHGLKEDDGHGGLNSLLLIA